jgi:hypothetical protein
VLLHGLQQGRLGLGRRPVDFVGQDDLGEDRPMLEAELAPPRGRVVHHDIRPDDVGGHEVRRELDAVEVQAQGLRQRADQVGLAQPRHALQQRVSAHEQAGQHAVHDLGMPDDRLADLLAQPGELLAELPRRLFHFRINRLSHETDLLYIASAEAFDRRTP